jgi:hypothetical protein
VSLAAEGGDGVPVEVHVARVSDVDEHPHGARQVSTRLARADKLRDP